MKSSRNKIYLSFKNPSSLKEKPWFKASFQISLEASHILPLSISTVLTPGVFLGGGTGRNGRVNTTIDQHLITEVRHCRAEEPIVVTILFVEILEQYELTFFNVSGQTGRP